MKNILLFLLLFLNLAFGYQNSYTREQVIKDFNKGDTMKYRNDHLQQLNFKSLQEKGILNDENLLINNSVTDMMLTAFLNGSGGMIYNYYKCPAVSPDWATSVWDIDFRKGELKCAVSAKKDLYNPIGYFVVKYPKTLDFFKKDEEAAKKALSSEISQSNNIYTQLYNEKLDIKNSVTEYAGQDYLNIPDLLLSAILTDIDVIDVEQSKSAKHLVLKDGFNSEVLSEDKEVNNNNKYISARTSTIVDVYAKLSDLSLEYLMYLAVFFGLFAFTKFFGTLISDRVEDVEQKHERKSPYVFGIILGVMLFLPTGETTIDADNTKYNVMHTNYQRFEKTGYYLFMNWADEAAKAIIDSEIDSIIDRAGISSSDTLINAYAYRKLYKDLKEANAKVVETCNVIYDENQIQKYSDDKNRVFPVSENYTYAMSYVLGNNGASYYSPVDKGGIVTNYVTTVPFQDGSYYPTYMLSACGKAEAKKEIYQNKIDEFQAKLDSAGFNNPEKLQQKVDVLSNMIRFQYELYRDYGLLAVLGLPVTIMQTENIGTMLDNSNKVNEELQKDIEKNDKTLHMVMSSLPYLWLPGGSATYDVVKDTAGGIASALLSWIPFFGSAAASVTGSAAGLAMAVAAGKTMLTLSPVIGIVLIGLLRFVIIYIKIFSFHFVSLLILPVMFARQNVQAIAAFTMKILATMLELPVFVLSIWLAITANSIMHSIGYTFTKKITLGLIEQNALQQGDWSDKLGIYFFDGLGEITIAVFSIIIIYKIIINIHGAMFELFEINGAEKLDEIASSVQNESASWGARI